MQAEPQATINVLPKSIKILTGLLLVMFPVGLFIMFSSWGKQFLWTTTLFLLLQALITFIILTRLADYTSVIISTILILIVSYFIEWWGVNTGFPFGYYSYSDTLKPLFNGVPIAITFAWFAVSVNSLLAARYLLKNPPGLVAAFISAAFILATDILLEPFASFINGYWTWVDNKIPLQNFFSWFVIGYLFSFYLNKLIKWKDTHNPALSSVSLIIIGINILNFAIVNLANRYFALTIVGLAVFGILFLSSKKYSLSQ